MSADEFTKALKEALNNQQVAILPATVTAVDVQSRTVDVVALGDMELYGVRLRAVVDEDPGHVIIQPTVGSQVLIARIGKGTEFTAIGYSQADKVEIKIGDTTLTVEVAGIRLLRAGQNLGDQIQQLISQIQAITVPITTAPGTSGPPINAAALEPIKSAIAQILI